MSFVSVEEGTTFFSKGKSHIDHSKDQIYDDLLSVYFQETLVDCN